MKRRYSYGNWRSPCISIIGRRESDGSVNQTFFIVITLRTVRECNRNSVIERINAIKKRTVNHASNASVISRLLNCLHRRQDLVFFRFFEIRRYTYIVYRTWHIQGYIRRPCFVYDNGSIWRNANQLSRRLFDTNGPESLFYHLSISTQN